jgi:hypothetical protein
MQHRCRIGSSHVWLPEKHIHDSKHTARGIAPRAVWPTRLTHGEKQRTEWGADTNLIRGFNFEGIVVPDPSGNWLVANPLQRRENVLPRDPWSWWWVPPPLCKRPQLVVEMGKESNCSEQIYSSSTNRIIKSRKIIVVSLWHESKYSYSGRRRQHVVVDEVLWCATSEIRGAPVTE